MAKKKKWTKQQCRDRYVRGEKISQRELSEQSNRAPTVLARWSKEEKWVQQREQYVRAVSVKTEEKVIEATSDRLADELTKMNEEHMKGFELFRKMSENCAFILSKELRNSSESDREKKVADKDFSLAVQRYGAVFTQMAQMQRLAMGMKYMDLDMAVQSVIKAGYEVNEPSEE